MERRTVSLCVIARDEEALLPRCLESAAAYVDEIVVVDTGSTDGTVSLSRALGARVVERPWRADFAAARNAGLDAATGRFILVLDADEAIENDCDPARFRAALDDAGEAWTVSLRDRLDGGGIRTYPLVRMFRNRPQYRYAGSIHEQITPSIAAFCGRERVEPADCGLRVEHLGYLHERVAARSKVERNLEMLRREIEARPDATAVRYFLIRELVPLRGGRAVPGEHLDEALRHCAWLAAGLQALSPRMRSDFIRIYAAALLADERVEEARQLIETLGDGSPGIALLRADVACILDAQRPERIARELEQLRSTFDRPSPQDALFDEPALRGPLARARAAELALALGDLDTAVQLAAEATALAGGGATPWVTLAAAEAGRGDLTQALRSSMEGLRRDVHDPWAWIALGELLIALGSEAEAEAPLRNALRLAPGWRRATVALRAVVPEDGIRSNQQGHRNSS